MVKLPIFYQDFCPANIRLPRLGGFARDIDMGPKYCFVHLAIPHPPSSLFRQMRYYSILLDTNRTMRTALILDDPINARPPL